MKYQILLIIIFLSFSLSLSNNFFIEKLDTNYTFLVLPNSSINIIVSPDIIEDENNKIIPLYQIEITYLYFFIMVPEYNTVKIIGKCEDGIKKIKNNDSTINIYLNLSDDILKCRVTSVLEPGNRYINMLIINGVYYSILVLIISFLFVMFLILHDLIYKTITEITNIKYKKY
jgi:hypothetical protein